MAQEALAAMAVNVAVARAQAVEQVVVAQVAQPMHALTRLAKTAHPSSGRMAHVPAHALPRAASAPHAEMAMAMVLAAMAVAMDSATASRANLTPCVPTRSATPTA